MAQSAEVEALVQRLQRLERDMRDLQASVYRGGQGAPASARSANPAVAADLTVRMTQLEEQLRELTGRQEELGYQMRTLSGRVEKLVADVDFRLAELERRVGVSASGAATPPPGQAQDTDPAGSAGASAPGAGTVAATPPPAAAGPDDDAGPTRPGTLPTGTPMEQYDYALSLLRKGQLDDAEAVLRAFLEQHPDDSLSGNAQFWLAEVYYQRKQFADAARLYLEGYQRYGENNKAPDMLLKLGMTLQQLGQPEEACGVFAELTDRYPQADNRIQAKLESERQKAQCS